jgi:hypothetical protein
MVINQTQIQCPNCGAPLPVALNQLVDVSQDPGAKSRLLSGTLNMVRCSNCGFEGQLATPLVYHDPEKELLLTFMPVELNLDKDEQEKLIGRLINKVVDNLSPDQRKGYLLQPQSVLTMQGLVERILEADGVTKEDIEAQRERMRLFENLLRTSEEALDDFIEQYDEQLDSAFFQLASVALQSTRDPNAREAANQRLAKAIEQSTFGKRLQAQEEEIQKAAESLNDLGKEITREAILDLMIEAPNVDRVVALVNLTNAVLDYGFFQNLSERIDSAEEEEQERLKGLRETILEVNEQIDKAREARVNQAASLLRSLMEASDLDSAIQSVLPLIDETFLAILQANMQAAQERGEQQALEKLTEINARINDLIQRALPEGLKLAQAILETEDEAQAQALMDESPEKIDDQMLGTLMGAAQQLESEGDVEVAERLKRLYKYGLKLSMKNKLEKNVG